MKIITTTIFVAAAAVGLTGCGAPANNAPANTNTNANTAKPVAAAPTADTLLSLEKAGTEAYLKNDVKAFDPYISEKYGESFNGKHVNKADLMKRAETMKCDIKESKFEEPQMSKIDDDTYVLAYKGTFEGSCTLDGKTEKIPNPMRYASVYVRNGDKWQAVWSGGGPLVEPKKDEKADSAKPTDMKKDDKAADAKDAKKEDAAKPAEKKDEKADAKKDDAKKDDKSAASNSAANSAPPAASDAAKPDANTDALVKVELAGWQAWRDKDAAKLDSFAYKNLAWIDPAGKWYGTRAEVLKAWDGSNCEGVKSVDVKNGFAWAISPTVEILSFVATSDGKCDGEKNGTQNGTSVYVKDGDTWKIAFSMGVPAGKM